MTGYFHLSRPQSAFVGMRPAERAAVLLALVLLMLGVGAVNLEKAQPSLVTVWLAFSFYITTLAIPFILTRRGWGWFHPLVFWVIWSQLIQYVFPRLGVYAGGLEAHNALPEVSSIELDWVVTKALLLTGVGMVTLYAGYMVPNRMAVPRLRFREPRLLLLKVVIVAFVAILAFFKLAIEIGGFGQLLLVRGMEPQARDAFVQQLGGRQWQFLVNVLKPACLVWLALRPQDWRRPIFIALFSLALLIGFAATGSRSGAVWPVLMAGIIWMLHYRRIPYTAIAFAFAVAMFVVGLGGQYRDQTRSANDIKDVGIDISVISNIQHGIEALIGRSTSNDGTYAILHEVPDNVGLLYGRSYLSIPFAPVPSPILPFDKPEAGGKLNAKLIYGNSNTAIPPGNIGEAYWNYYVPGVLVVMFLFGIILKWFGRLYIANEGRSWVVAIYVITLFSLKPNSPSVYNWLHNLVPVILLLVFYCGVPRSIRRTSQGQRDNLASGLATKKSMI